MSGRLPGPNQPPGWNMPGRTVPGSAGGYTPAGYRPPGNMPPDVDIYGQPINTPQDKPRQARRPRRHPSTKKRVIGALGAVVVVIALVVIGVVTRGFGIWATKADGAFSSGLQRQWSHHLPIADENKMSSAARFTPFSVTRDDYSQVMTVVPTREGASLFRRDVDDGQQIKSPQPIRCDTLQACMPQGANPALMPHTPITVGAKGAPQVDPAMDRILWSDTASGVTVGAATVDGSVNGLVSALMAYSADDQRIIWTQELPHAGRVLMLPGGIIVTYTDANGQAFVDYYADKHPDPAQVRSAAGQADATMLSTLDFGQMRWTFLGHQAVNLIKGTGYFSVDIKADDVSGRYVNFASVTPPDGSQIAVDATHGQLDFQADRTLFADIDGDGFDEALTFVSVQQPFDVGDITLAGQPNTRESTSEFGYVWTWSQPLGSAEMIPDPIYHVISNDTYRADPTKAGAQATSITADGHHFVIRRDSERARQAGFPTTQVIAIHEGELWDDHNSMWGGACMASDVGDQADTRYPLDLTHVYATPTSADPVSVSATFDIDALVAQSAVFITDLPDTSMRSRQSRALVGVPNDTMSPGCYWRQE